jgi:hypothetical protein
VLAYRDHSLAVLEQQLKNRGDGVADSRQEPPKSKQKQYGENTTVNARLQQLITGMLAKEPADRPSAQEVAATTATLLADLGAPLPVHGWMRMQFERSRRLPQRKRLQLALVAALVVGVLLGSLGGLLISWPSTADALDGDAQATTSQSQAIVFQRQTTPTGALSPEPTRVPLTAVATQPPPTLIPLQTPSTKPPTLVPFTPVPQDTPAGTQPAVSPPAGMQTTANVLANVPTNVPLVTPVQRPNTPQPSPTPRPAVAEQATIAPMVVQVQLLAPESGTRSDQGKVEFSWQIGAQPLADDHCFELVFWSPDKPADKRSPVGSGKATRRRVDFTLLFNSSDPLLRALTQSDRDFNWGVRIVSCASPRTVLQDVQQVRIYSYRGQ